MSACRYDVDDQGPTAVGRGLFMAGCVAVVWGAGTVALVVATIDVLWRRGRR